MTERKRTRICATCRYGTTTGAYLNGLETITCRRRAPTPDCTIGFGARARWPVTQGDEWCGEYTDK